jgi:glycosyltransferase involved in cell wall biosynthesis
MGMGIPLLCNSGVGDTDAIVSHYGSGMVIDLRDADAMKQAVLKFDTLKNISPESIIRGAREFFSLESGSEKYLAIYRKLDS